MADEVATTRESSWPILATIGDAAPSEPVRAAVFPLMLDKDDVAGLLRVPSATVENLHRTGQLRGRMVGKHLRWRPGDVRRFVEALEEG